MSKELRLNELERAKAVRNTAIRADLEQAMRVQFGSRMDLLARYDAEVIADVEGRLGISLKNYMLDPNTAELKRRGRGSSANKATNLKINALPKIEG